jgi:hypothetical protein
MLWIKIVCPRADTKVLIFVDQYFIQLRNILRIALEIAIFIRFLRMLTLCMRG